MIPISRWLRDNRHSAVGDVADEIMALLQESREDGIEQCARWHAEVAAEIRQAQETIDGEGMARMVALKRAEAHERHADYLRTLKNADKTDSTSDMG